MKVPLDVRCLECGQVFCCGDCRKRHEANVHGFVYDCRLCRFDLFTLDTRETLVQQLLDHVSQSHLPLRCIKCNKLYEKMEDLTDGERCQLLTVERIRKEVVVTEPQEEVSSIKSKSKIIQNEGVMTSTPTHPCKPAWGLFHKSFTSTISVINSPDSDVQSSPNDEKEIITSSNQISSIHGESSANPKCQELKGIISKRPKITSVDSSDCSPSSDRPSSEDLTEDKAVDEDGQHFTPPMDNSSDKRKRVTFADHHQPVNKPAVVKPHVFVKPKRAATPMRYKPKRHRTPRFQAIINNFESRASRQPIGTPNTVRPPQVNDETPPSTEQNAIGIMARTIDFKQASPTTSEEMIVSPKANPETALEIASPVDTDDEYKSCIVESPQLGDVVKTNQMETVEDLPKQIAVSIQQSLNHALNSEDFSTEIQFKIVVTKKVVSIRETTKTKDDRRIGSGEGVKRNESTTVWSRLVDGVKWVIWGDRDNRISDSCVQPTPNKRKRLQGGEGAAAATAPMCESPVSKRYRYSGRISGRRPLDRVLKGETFAHLERSNSFGADVLKENNPERDEPLNRSF